MQDDPRLRFSLYVDGKLVAMDWLDASQDESKIDDVTHRHLQIAAAAERLGSVTMVEIYDPSLPEDRAYTRIGTDKSMMSNPVAVSK